MNSIIVEIIWHGSLATVVSSFSSSFVHVIRNELPTYYRTSVMRVPFKNSTLHFSAMIVWRPNSVLFSDSVISTISCSHFTIVRCSIFDWDFSSFLLDRWLEFDIFYCSCSSFSFRDANENSRVIVTDFCAEDSSQNSSLTVFLFLFCKLLIKSVYKFVLNVHEWTIRWKVAFN